MSTENNCIAVYKTHHEAEAAVKKLEHDGFNLKHLSVVGKGYHSEEHPIGYYNTGDRVKFWGKQGAFWGGLWGILFGSAFFWIPGIGPLAVAGSFASVLVGGISGAVMTGSLTALGAALFSIGIPKDSILKYEEALKADKFILICQGSNEEVERARSLLEDDATADSVDVHTSV